MTRTKHSSDDPGGVTTVAALGAEGPCGGKRTARVRRAFVGASSRGEKRGWIERQSIGSGEENALGAKRVSKM